METASTWAAIAALAAVGFAWFTYIAAAKASNERKHKGLQNTILGIEKELDLIASWAGDKEKGVGYLASTAKECFEEKFQEWSNPGRTIYTFDYPTIKNLTASDYVGYLRPIIDDFVTLNYSIVRLYNMYEEYRYYARARLNLFDSVSKKHAEAKESGTFSQGAFDQAELEYMGNIYGYNYQIHVKLIGGEDTKDERCLFKAFNRAKDNLKQFKQEVRPDPLPRWYLIGHITASVLFLVAASLLLQWLIRLALNLQSSHSIHD